MRTKTVEDIKQKFFFDHNIFDADGNIESELLEEEEPPIPVFSEAELEAAKKAAFQNGHEQAMQEAKASRAQHLAGVLGALAKDMTSLFAQEDARERLYEREVVALVSQIYEKLFPHYAEKAGFGELTAALGNVLGNHSRQSLVLVRIHPDVSDGVEKFLQKLQSQNPELRYTVQGDETLSAYSCSLSWEDGGALHNNEALAEEILGILKDGSKDGLAGGAAKRHDGRKGGGDETAPQAALSETEERNENQEHPDLKERPDE